MSDPAPLCRLDDILDGGSNGFFTDTAGGADGRLLYMVIRQGTEVFVYENRCPHTGLPLDFQPGRFLTADGDLIQCLNHGAQFRIKDGFCVSGPCEGKSLKPLKTKIRGGQVFLAA
jgi:nitrite reductase/ring-hydroxylating ferredoxin subunit